MKLSHVQLVSVHMYYDEKAADTQGLLSSNAQLLTLQANEFGDSHSGTAEENRVGIVTVVSATEAAAARAAATVADKFGSDERVTPGAR